MGKKVNGKAATAAVNAIANHTTELAYAFDISENGADFMRMKILQFAAELVSAIYDEEHDLGDRKSMTRNVEDLLKELEGK